MISEGGSYSVSRYVRPWIKFTPEYPFNLSANSFDIGLGLTQSKWTAMAEVCTLLGAILVQLQFHKHYSHHVYVYSIWWFGG